MKNLAKRFLLGLVKKRHSTLVGLSAVTVSHTVILHSWGPLIIGMILFFADLTIFTIICLKNYDEDENRCPNCFEPLRKDTIKLSDYS